MKPILFLNKLTSLITERQESINNRKVLMYVKIFLHFQPTQSPLPPPPTPKKKKGKNPTATANYTDLKNSQ